MTRRGKTIAVKFDAYESENLIKLASCTCKDVKEVVLDAIKFYRSMVCLIDEYYTYWPVEKQLKLEKGIVIGLDERLYDVLRKHAYLTTNRLEEAIKKSLDFFKEMINAIHSYHYSEYMLFKTKVFDIIRNALDKGYLKSPPNLNEVMREIWELIYSLSKPYEEYDEYIVSIDLTRISDEELDMLREKIEEIEGKRGIDPIEYLRRKIEKLKPLAPFLDDLSVVIDPDKQKISVTDYVLRRRHFWRRFYYEPLKCPRAEVERPRAAVPVYIELPDGFDHVVRISCRDVRDIINEMIRILAEKVCEVNSCISKRIDEMLEEEEEEEERVVRRRTVKVRVPEEYYVMLEKLALMRDESIGETVRLAFDWYSSFVNWICDTYKKKYVYPVSSFEIIIEGLVRNGIIPEVEDPVKLAKVYAVTVGKLVTILIEAFGFKEDGVYNVGYIKGEDLERLEYAILEVEGELKKSAWGYLQDLIRDVDRIASLGWVKEELGIDFEKTGGIYESVIFQRIYEIRDKFFGVGTRYWIHPPECPGG